MLWAQVNPGKSRQIVANEKAGQRTSEQTRSLDGWYLSGLMRYDFCGGGIAGAQSW
jgi:hypothetical protein